MTATCKKLRTVVCANRHTKVDNKFPPGSCPKQIRQCIRLNAAAFLFITLLSKTAATANQSLPLRIEVLMQPTPVYRVQAQTWTRVFQQMEFSAVFRTGRDGERTRVEETEFQGRKSITAVGILNRDGSITFTDQTFVALRPEPLKAWLDRLKQFGPNGPPNESPTWGLSEDQFAEVLKLLAAPVSDPVKMKSPLNVVDSLKLPDRFQITFTDAGRQRAFPKTTYTPAAMDDFSGLSKGSTLAAALAQFGLGFRPKAGPNGRFLLEIDAGTEADNMYPVGWKNTGPIMNVVPDLGKTIPVDLDKANVKALIALIAGKLNVATITSAYALAIEGRNTDTMTYSRKPDKLPIQSLMDNLGAAKDIALSLRTDEAGNIFLWVTTIRDEAAFKTRFAHIRPSP